MIIGAFIRYFKTYQGINYIPISDEDNFCGLLGNNGAGKSSVLEAIDCIFNGKVWNFNTATKKSGLESTNPFVVPVFLFKKSFLKDQPFFNAANALSETSLSLTETDVVLALRTQAKQFIEHRKKLIQKINIEDYLLLPIGKDKNNNTFLTLFNTPLLISKLHRAAPKDKQALESNELTEFDDLLKFILNTVEYIYIPKEIEPQSFTKLETQEIQVLMGESLHTVLNRKVTNKQISEINKSLNEFIDDLSNELLDYSYRTPTDRQQNLKRNDINNLIIESFFGARKLHKKQGEYWLEISTLSSGEKQKAIIDVAHRFLKKHRNTGENLIIAVDEPESSLHMSACYDQFQALFDISRDCMQVIFSSHWYGFLPTMESGSVTVISKGSDDHLFDLINLSSYREQVKQLATNSRGTLPYDIRLKSINDFVQSIITSSIGDTAYNWLICEGSSERIYFTHYFKELIEKKRLRIVPVGGAKEVKRIYEQLLTCYEDFRNEIQGKIILISDTDAELIQYQTKDLPNLICKRIVNNMDLKVTQLVNIDSNPVSPATEIEDALNGKLFFETLKDLTKEEKDFEFISSYSSEIPHTGSRISLDFRGSEWSEIQKFFDRDNNKFKFAQAYSKKLGDAYDVPPWIIEIRNMFMASQTPGQKRKEIKKEKST